MKKEPRLPRADKFICCQGDRAARPTRYIIRRQRAVTRRSFARYLAIVSRPVDAELDGEPPLDLGREHMLAMVRRLGVVARLAVFLPPRLVGLVEPVDGLR
jgi:hypothetical protein